MLTMPETDANQAILERFDRLEARTDRRFDETLATMKEGFAQAEARSLKIEVEMKAGFERVDERFERMDAKFEGKFERLYQLVIKIGAGLIGTLVAAIVTVILTHL